MINDKNYYDDSARTSLNRFVSLLGVLLWLLIANAIMIELCYEKNSSRKKEFAAFISGNKTYKEL